jgi:hypothetical protein
MRISAVILLACSCAFAEHGPQPETLYVERPEIDLNAGLLGMDGEPRPALKRPDIGALNAFVAGCVVCYRHADGRILWRLMLEWKTTPERQNQLKQLIAAEQAKGKVWRTPRKITKETVPVTTYEPGATPEDPPVPVVVQKNIRSIAAKFRFAGYREEEE